VSAQTIEELREAANGLSGALQLASRQVEVLLARIDRMGTDCADEEASDACCISCPMRGRDCAVKCIDNMRQWSLEQAKKGGVKV
jgi:hypothetical protein